MDDSSSSIGSDNMDVGEEMKKDVIKAVEEMVRSFWVRDVCYYAYYRSL